MCKWNGNRNRNINIDISRKRNRNMYITYNTRNGKCERNRNNIKRAYTIHNGDIRGNTMVNRIIHRTDRINHRNGSIQININIIIHKNINLNRNKYNTRKKCTNINRCGTYNMYNYNRDIKISKQGNIYGNIYINMNINMCMYININIYRDIHRQ